MCWMFSSFASVRLTFPLRQPFRPPHIVDDSVQSSLPLSFYHQISLCVSWMATVHLLYNQGAAALKQLSKKKKSEKMSEKIDSFSNQHASPQITDSQHLSQRPARVIHAK